MADDEVTAGRSGGVGAAVHSAGGHRSLWRFKATAGPLGVGFEVDVDYYPGMLVDILKAEIADPLTLLFQKVMHITEFVGSPVGARGSGHGDEVSVQRLRKRLQTARVTSKPMPIRVTGIFSAAVLLSYGWWERTGPGAKPVGRNDIQRWAYAGFEEWAPSWDFNGEADTDDESFFLGQLGHGDEANSVLVVAVGERARAIRPGIVGYLADRNVAAAAVEVTGLLCHRSHLSKHNPELAVVAERWHRDFNYCLLLDSDNHRITPVYEVPDFYSAYLWKCLWAKDKAKKDAVPTLNDCYLIWEHTDLTKPGAIEYNLDSLEHKQEFLTKKYGAMELLQKSGPLVTGKPSLSASSFQGLFGAGQPVVTAVITFRELADEPSDLAVLRARSTTRCTSPSSPTRTSGSRWRTWPTTCVARSRAGTAATAAPHRAGAGR